MSHIPATDVYNSISEKSISAVSLQYCDTTNVATLHASAYPDFSVRANFQTFFDAVSALNDLNLQQISLLAFSTPHLLHV